MSPTDEFNTTMTDEILMPCDHPDCGRESTHSIGRWINPDSLHVDYFCPEHAPAGATTFEEDDAEWDALLEAGAEDSLGGED